MNKSTEQDEGVFLWIFSMILSKYEYKFLKYFMRFFFQKNDQFTMNSIIIFNFSRERFISKDAFKWRDLVICANYILNPGSYLWTVFFIKYKWTQLLRRLLGSGVVYRCSGFELQTTSCHRIWLLTWMIRAKSYLYCMTFFCVVWPFLFFLKDWYIRLWINILWRARQWSISWMKCY